MLKYKMLSIRRSNLSLRWPSHSLRHFFPRSLAMLDTTQKTTITRFVQILPAVARSYWEHNGNELAASGPKSIVAGFQFPPPTATQRASMPEGEFIIEYSCDMGPSSLHPGAPIEATAERWSTKSSRVFPSMDLLSALVVLVRSSSWRPQQLRTIACCTNPQTNVSIPPFAYTQGILYPPDTASEPQFLCCCFQSPAVLP